MNVEVVKVPLGDKVQLNCSAFGSPSPNLYWKREDRNIHTNYKHEISVKKNGNNSSSQLTIKNLSKEDHYVTYTCLGKNSQGTAVDAVSIQVTGKVNTIYQGIPICIMIDRVKNNTIFLVEIPALLSRE